MFCTKCGREQLGNPKFCRSCGTRLSQVPDNRFAEVAGTKPNIKEDKQLQTPGVTELDSEGGPIY